MEIDMSQMGMAPPPMGLPKDQVKLACLDLASKTNPASGEYMLRDAKIFYDWISEKR